MWFEPWSARFTQHANDGGIVRLVNKGTKKATGSRRAASVTRPHVEAPDECGWELDGVTGLMVPIGPRAADAESAVADPDETPDDSTD